MATTPAYRRWFCLTPIGLGLVVSGYLLARTFTLLADHATDAIDVCSAIFRTGCDKTLLSNTSWQLGIPLAGWGIVFYGTLAGLLVLGWSVGGGFQRAAALGALLLTAAGAIASATLAGVIIAGAAPFCPFCMVIHLINLGLVAAVWWLNGLTVREVWDSFRIAGAYWLKGDTEDAQGARWSIVGFVSTALLAVVLYQWVLVQTERRISAASFFDPQQVLATYSSTPRQPVTIHSTDPRLGTADAAVQLAVFSSFQCPGCQEFATEMVDLADRYVGKLVVIFKHYPLGTACNASSAVDQHPRSCEAAWAAEAAHRQGKFWAFHDALFASELDAEEETIQRIAVEVDLDPARFATDRAAKATLDKVKTDIELGTRLGVDATPAIFLNGRRLKSAGRRTLQLLIEAEIESAHS